MITADDYGMSASINQAIESLIDVGAIDGFSVMIFGDVNPKYLNYIRKKNNIKIGLHLDLNHFVNLKSRNIIIIYIYSCLSPNFRRKIKYQITCQIRQFEERFGYFPDYVDGHQHAQMLRPVIEAIAEVITYPDKHFWIRNSASQKNNIKSYLIRLISYRNWKKFLNLRGFKYKNLYGVYNFKKQSDFLNNLKSYQDIKGRSSNFMVHPCIDIKHGKFRKYEFDILMQGH